MTQGALLGVDLPTGWSWEPLGFMAPRITGAGRGDLQPLSVYLGAGVVRRADREDNHNVLGADLDKYLHVMPGDLVFNKLRTWQGGLGASKYEGIVSPAYYVMRTGERLDARFANYVLVSSPYLAELTRLSKFMPPSQFDMPWESLKRLPMLVPPVEEQRRIADFLDDQVGRIDKAQAINRRLLALAAERRMVAITEAVTHGIRRDSMLMPSGIPWIGEVPAHWELRRLKTLGTARIGLTYNPADEVGDSDSGTLVLRSGNVQDERIDLGDCVFVTSRIPEQLRLRENDLLICSRNGSARLIGKSALIGPEQVGASWGAFMTVFRSAINDYLAWVFRSSLFTQQLGLFSTSTINQLTSATLHNFQIPLPPPAEQEAIGKYLNTSDEAIRKLQRSVARSTASLEERKRALITAAVTGQMDVSTAKPIGMGKWVPNVGANIEVSTVATTASIGGI